MAKNAEIKHETPEISAELLGQTLVEVDLFALPQEEGDKVSLRYHASIDLPEKLAENRYFFRCEFSVTKRKAGSDDALQSVMASYACILQHPSNDISAVEVTGKKFVATSAWNAFSSLFALVSHQMKTPFPPLPPTPGGVISSGRSSFEDYDVDEAEEAVADEELGLTPSEDGEI